MDHYYLLTFSGARFDLACLCNSRHAEKYIRRGRLNWPEGATSRESIKSVMKLPRLQVIVLIISALAQESM